MIARFFSQWLKMNKIVNYQIAYIMFSNKNKNQRKIIILIFTISAVVILLICLIIFLIQIGYMFDWTGFNGYTITTISKTIGGTTAPTTTTTTAYQPGKTLYDWLQLIGVLAIP